MKTLEILIDCEFMVQFEHCEHFIAFVKKTIKAKRNFRGIKINDCLNRVIILSGQSNAKTVFNLAVMASDIVDIIYEYNQTRKKQGKSLFFVNVYAIINDNGLISKKKYLYLQNNIQWRN